jgi:hypothetical protein
MLVTLNLLIALSCDRQVQLARSEVYSTHGLKRAGRTNLGDSSRAVSASNELDVTASLLVSAGGSSFLGLQRQPTSQQNTHDRRRGKREGKEGGGKREVEKGGIFEGGTAAARGKFLSANGLDRKDRVGCRSVVVAS